MATLDELRVLSAEMTMKCQHRRTISDEQLNSVLKVLTSVENFIDIWERDVDTMNSHELQTMDFAFNSFISEFKAHMK